MSCLSACGLVRALDPGAGDALQPLEQPGGRHPQQAERYHTHEYVPGVHELERLPQEEAEARLGGPISVMKTRIRAMPAPRRRPVKMLGRAPGRITLTKIW